MMKYSQLYQILPNELYSMCKQCFADSSTWPPYTETPKRRGKAVSNVVVLCYLDTVVKQRICKELHVDHKTVRLRDATYCVDDNGFYIDWHFDEVNRKAISCILYMSNHGSGTTIIDDIRTMNEKEIIPFENKALAFIPEVGRSFHCVKKTDETRETIQIFYEKIV